MNSSLLAAQSESPKIKRTDGAAIQGVEAHQGTETACQPRTHWDMGSTRTGACWASWSAPVPV